MKMKRVLLGVVLSGLFATCSSALTVVYKGRSYEQAHPFGGDSPAWSLAHSANFIGNDIGYRGANGSGGDLIVWRYIVVRNQTPKLTEADKAQLKTIRDKAYALIRNQSAVIKNVDLLSKTYKAADTILRPSPTDAPGDPLNKLAACLDLWNLWRPESAIDAFSPAIEEQYSTLLRSIAAKLNTIAKNIEQTDMRGGKMIHGVDDIKILIATLFDKRAKDASAVPNSLITQFVVDWYAENYAKLIDRVGSGPRIQRSWLGQNDVDRNALKVWFFNHKTVVKNFRYGGADVPDDVSYFNTVPFGGMTW